MPLLNTQIIDRLELSQNSETLILYIEDYLPWSDKQTHLLRLREKIEFYLNYIDNEQYLDEADDDISIKDFIINIDSAFEIPDDVQDELDDLMPELEQHNASLQVTYPDEDDL